MATYANEYNRRHYKRASLVIPIKLYPEIVKHIEDNGYSSFNGYVMKLISDDMKKGLKTQG